MIQLSVDKGWAQTGGLGRADTGSQTRCFQNLTFIESCFLNYRAQAQKILLYGIVHAGIL